MGLEITNRVRSEIIFGAMLSDVERREFGYLDGEDLDSNSFVRDADGKPYDLNEFCSCPPDIPGFEEWDAYKGEGFFMGKVIRYLPDEGDMVEIADYMS